MYAAPTKTKTKKSPTKDNTTFSPGVGGSITASIGYSSFFFASVPSSFFTSAGFDPQCGGQGLLDAQRGE
jgi:hypothetical protein